MIKSSQKIKGESGSEMEQNEDSREPFANWPDCDTFFSRKPDTTSFTRPVIVRLEVAFNLGGLF